MSRDGSNVDHVPLAARSEAGQERPREAHHGDHIGINHCRYVGHIISVGAGRAQREAGVVDEDGDLIETKRVQA